MLVARGILNMRFEHAASSCMLNMRHLRVLICHLAAIIWHLAAMCMHHLEQMATPTYT
jgi:hypothetical protein